MGHNTGALSSRVLRLTATLQVPEKTKQQSLLVADRTTESKAILEDKYLHDIQTAHDERFLLLHEVFS